MSRSMVLFLAFLPLPYILANATNFQLRLSSTMIKLRMVHAMKKITCNKRTEAGHEITDKTKVSLSRGTNEEERDM